MPTDTVGLQERGLGWLRHAIHDATHAAADLLCTIGLLLGWFVGAAIGLIATPAMGNVISPLGRQVRLRHS